MNKTTLLSIAAILASSSVLTNASQSAVLSQPDPGNALEQRIDNLSTDAWTALEQSRPNNPDLIARFWGNGGGRAWGNGGGRRYRGWGNGRVRGFGNGGPRLFLNGAPRRGFANW
ncbi:MAG: rSAM-associated Gly-rich repeat protein [Propionibacteriaceae bacterium]|jgi:rSAM-associated Gly-rich repeat protein|nr:rSAM-associated Gly-rich repeat protein [Propionibacteriaceae bacterium]